MAVTPAGYRERGSPPLWWALPAAGAVATTALALAAALGPGTAALGAAVVAIGCGLGALALSRGTLRVDATAVLVDRARLPLAVLAGARALTDTEAARLRGPGYDPRGCYRIRGWIRGAVLLELRDPADPTPFWYVSSRRPDLVVAAIAAAAGPAAAGPAATGPAATATEVQSPPVGAARPTPGVRRRSPDR